MKKHIPLIAALVVIAIFIGGFAYLIKTDGQMPFPRKPQGKFIQGPQLETVDGEQKITWVLPEGGCVSAEYQVQEVGYTPENRKLWGGNSAECSQQERGYVCEAGLHPDMVGRDGEWRIQARAGGCERRERYESEIATITTQKEKPPTR